MNIQHTRSFVLFLFIILFSSFAPAEENSITVEITNLRNSKGAVLISLYNSANADHFTDDPAKYAVGKKKVTIRNNKAYVTFSDLPLGKYAVAIMHDENDNNKMDFNIVRMPKEGYGFSNDAKVVLGPPSFEKAAFDLRENTKTISIKMTYF